MNVQRTIGFDFGTHQTKICVENKYSNGHLEYEFFSFPDKEGKEQYVLPSVIKINSDQTLSYGYVDYANYSLSEGKFIYIKCLGDNGISIIKGLLYQAKDHFCYIKYESKINKTLDAELRERGAYIKELDMYVIVEGSLPVIYDLCDTSASFANKRNKQQGLGLIMPKSVNTLDQVEKTFNYQIPDQVKRAIMDVVAEDEKESSSPNIIRYFKQQVFTGTSWNYEITAMEASVWYIAFVMFELERDDVYGTAFNTQMGIPTSSTDFERKKEIAVSILLSAFDLVENKFDKDKQAFLNSTIQELREKTEIIPFSEKMKMEYSIKVYPEAFACLRPLIKTKRQEDGMQAMVDIGGGTTDISFFTISEGQQQIYHYKSIPKGLNYLSGQEESTKIKYADEDRRIKILDGKLIAYRNELKEVFYELDRMIRNGFKMTLLSIRRLEDALRDNPLTYTGGGATFKQLRNHYLTFSVKLIDEKYWPSYKVKDYEVVKNLSPILSTSYGLAISSASDEEKIDVKDISDLFKHLKGLGEGTENEDTYGGHAKSGDETDVHTSWMYKEPWVLNPSLGGKRKKKR